jgi:hypothetical protein
VKFKDIYNLDAEESEILGRWRAVGFKYFTNVYYFYPNKLFITYLPLKDYSFTGKKWYLGKGIGVWELRNGKIIATIYSFTKENDNEKELIPVAPYEIEIVDIKYINSAGYSEKSFNTFELPPELITKVTPPENSDGEYFWVRMLYFINTVGPSTKNYGYFEIALWILEQLVEFAPVFLCAAKVE